MKLVQILSDLLHYINATLSALQRHSFNVSIHDSATEFCVVSEYIERVKVVFQKETGELLSCVGSGLM